MNDNSNYPNNIDRLNELRAEVFDRWCWETGSAEDLALVREIDNAIESIIGPFDAGMFYCPYIPILC